jgi:cyanoexosortase B
MQQKAKSPNLIQNYLFELILLALLIILYLPLIIYWYDGWLNKTISIEHEYFSHGLIGLPFSAYIIWTQRKKWSRLNDHSHPLGAVGLGIATLFYLSQVPELINLSFPIILIGICLWLKGIPGLKLQAFPLLFITLSTPNSVPYLIAPFTLPLQQFIATVAAFILIHLGFNVNVENIYLSVDGRYVEVAPYCAGLKMLFTSLYVALLLLYWTDNIYYKKRTIYLLSGTVFISVVANIIRNTVLTYFHGTGQDNMFAWLHEGWGGDLYSALMLGTIIILLKLLEKWDIGGDNGSIQPIVEVENNHDLE